MRALLVVVQAPLALLSFLLFKVVQFLMRRLANLHYRRRKEQAFRWHPLSAETLKNPLALPLLMTSAPRWNPHAIIATLGPLPVQESLTIDVTAARLSAPSWSIVVYSFPGFRTVTSINSLDCPADVSTRTLTLKPGRYWIGLRYYRWGESVALPGMQVDGRPAVAPMPLPAGVNAFYHELSRRRSWWYCLLHYHAWVALLWKDRLPRRLVERIVLPVGNPGTAFHYGVIGKGERLRIEMDEEVKRGADVYLTIYNRASFPVKWEGVTQGIHESERMTAGCMYLIRVLPRTTGLVRAIVE